MGKGKALNLLSLLNEASKSLSPNLKPKAKTNPLNERGISVIRFTNE